MKNARLLLFAAILFAPAAGGAQETVAFKLTPPAGKVRLAEVFRLKVEASCPEKYSIELDTTSLDGADFSLVEAAAGRAASEGGLRKQTFDLKVQAFTIGISTFPELAWRLNAAGAEPAAARSPSFLLEITPAFENAPEGIRDIYPPFSYPPWPWILAGLLAAAAGLAAWSRRRSSQAAVWAAWRDARPPYLRALDRLAAVRRSPLPAAGRVKDYYVGLTSVLRFYLAEQFALSAELMTSADLARELKRTGADLKTTLKTREFLQKADLAKFARHKPENPDSDAAALEGLLADFNAIAETSAASARPPAPGGKPS
jgi:hypothetical protein